MRGSVQFPGGCGHRAVLDRLLQLVAESTDLRVLQPRLQGSIQEYAAVRVPVLPVVLPKGGRLDGHELRLIRPQTPSAANNSLKRYSNNTLKNT